VKKSYWILSLLVIFPALLYANNFHSSRKGINKMSFFYDDPKKEKKKPVAYVDFHTGIYLNKTFGIHPILGARLGLRCNKSGYYLAAEFRFGKSKEKFDAMVDDSLISTDHFRSEFVGLEYDRLIFAKKNHELGTTVSLGYDWISLPEVNDNIERKGGIAFNIGLGYLFKFKKGAGPQIKFLYHFADVDNQNGTDPNKNSFIIRLTYVLGYND
jgi:hypothetical protein